MIWLLVTGLSNCLYNFFNTNIYDYQLSFYPTNKVYPFTDRLLIIHSGFFEDLEKKN